VGNDVTTGPIMYKEDMKNRAEQKIVVEKQDYCRVLFAGISLQHETHVLYSYVAKTATRSHPTIPPLSSSYNSSNSNSRELPSRKDNARRVPKAMPASPSTSKSLTVGLCSGLFSEQNHQHGILRSAAPCTTLHSGGGPPTTRWCALGVFASAECQRGCSC
jgi:hypothetical protein